MDEAFSGIKYFQKIIVIFDCTQCEHVEHVKNFMPPFVPDLLWPNGGLQFTASKLSNFLKLTLGATATVFSHYLLKGMARLKLQSIVLIAWTGKSNDWDKLSLST